MKQIKKVSLKWRLMLAIAGMTASAVWGQGIIHVCPQPQPYYITFGSRDTDIDINGDGVPDFALYSTDVSLNYTWLAPLNGSQIVTGPPGNNAVANMAMGDIVGPSVGAQYVWSDTTSLIGMVAVMFGGPSGGIPSEGGNFVGQMDGYIGFDLVQGDDNYYGWIHIYDSLHNLALYGEVVEWAYSTVPNAPIMVGQVPEPGTLGLLGLGGLTLLTLRRARRRPSCFG